MALRHVEVLEDSKLELEVLDAFSCYLRYTILGRKGLRCGLRAAICLSATRCQMRMPSLFKVTYMAVSPAQAFAHFERGYSHA